MLRLVYRAHHVAGDRADQRQPGQHGDEGLGHGGEQQDDGAGEAAAEQVEHAVGDPGDVALVGILVGILAGAQGRGDGGDDDGDAAEAGDRQRGQAGDGDQRLGRGVVAGAAQDGHARQELPGQADQHQRDGQAQGGAPGPLRRDEQRCGQAQLDALQVGAFQADGQGHPDDQQQHQAIAGKQALEHQVGADHAERQGRHAFHRLERAHAELEQDAGHHRAGDALGDGLHDAVEPAGNADQENRHARGEVGAHRLIEAEFGEQGDQQRRAGRRPGGHHRHLEPPAEQDAGQRRADRDGPDPGGHHRRGDLGALRGLEEDDQRP
ncbi:hypothetical protein D3C78_1146510 [compost metagenome]